MKRSFDVTDLYAMAETVETIFFKSRAAPSAAEQFRSVIMNKRPRHSKVAFSEVYQKQDAVIKYLQWFFINHASMSVEETLYFLYEETSETFWPVDTPMLDGNNLENLLHTTAAVLPSFPSIFRHYPLKIFLLDGQHNSRNGEASAVFHADGMESGIRLYRMQTASNFMPAQVLLHELGHLLHIADTQKQKEVPRSFPLFLDKIGADYRPLSQGQLLELFADTFLIAVTFQARLFGDPFPEIPNTVKQGCLEYIRQLCDKTDHK